MKKSLKLAHNVDRICKRCHCGLKEKVEKEKLMAENKKIKVACVKFCLGADGGSEKFLQTVIANLPKDKFYVDAFYTNAATYLGSDWVHPDNNPENLKYLEDNGVNLIPVHVEHKDVRVPTHDWVGSNFFELFDESKYDVVLTVRAGHSEYPYNLIKTTPILEIVTLPGMADRQSNIFKTVHISEFQKSTWVQAGGDERRTTVIPIVSDILTPSGNHLLNELNIPEDSFVFGFHQREDDGIFSPVSLEAYKKVMTNKTWFIIMGGSKLYSKFAEANKLTNFIQLPFSGNSAEKDRFLSTLDVYAHARRDGETFGLAISEAMSYGLPILSHTAPAMGHVETIGNGGFVCGSVDEYAAKMQQFMDDRSEDNDEHSVYNIVSSNAIGRYNQEFSVASAISKFVAIFDEIMKEKEKDNMSDEDFWNAEY